jgi:hypothetical protein
MSHNHQGRWFYSRGESPEREPLGVRVLIVGSGGAGSGPLRFAPRRSSYINYLDVGP